MFVGLCLNGYYRFGHACCLDDLSRLETFDADANFFVLSVYDSLDRLKVGHETTVGYPGDLFSDAAVTFCLTAPCDGPAGFRSFSAYKTDT